MRLLPSSTAAAGAAAGLAAAAALALRADPAALVLLAAWCGLALLASPGQGRGAGSGPWLRAALAVALAWRMPGWPAAALVAALLLEVAAGRLTALAAARTGIALPGLDLHTLVLAGGRAADVVAALAVAAMILLPERQPLIASALAGLTAMGAIARASLALAVVRGVRDEA
ncbi:hypothetical protein DK419_05620 [Methylobacterium terrae]|uniref:Uncharacterized protein n=1 Tax=Methylobacterium terrae TaxID=2202827 RepID=A0A2U8WKC5_9HYPH|nr:hypothetical protein [Methylobacterium terrae]AWN45860.1 hypothetical protein DK419_05620 [Methylobacterium terrae]